MSGWSQLWFLRIAQLLKHVGSKLRWRLPLDAIDFDAHFDGAIEVFLAALVVNAELQRVAVAQWERAACGTRWRKAHAVKECAATRLGVADEHLSGAVAPDLGVKSTYHLALEGDTRLVVTDKHRLTHGTSAYRRLARGRRKGLVQVPFREPTHLHSRPTFSHLKSGWKEEERAGRINKWGEDNSMTCADRIPNFAALMCAHLGRSR